MNQLASIVILLALAGCAHRSAAAPSPVPRDLSQGFLDEDPGSQIPIGPLPGDEPAFGVLKDMSEHGDFGHPTSDDELREALRKDGVSQTMRAAAALPVLRAGVVYNNVGLMSLACDLAADVTDGRVRRAADVDVVTDTCAALAPSGQPYEECPKSRELARDGYTKMQSGLTAEARTSIALALRAQSTCPDGRGLTRTPVAPEADAFPIVAVLQIVEAPERAYLGGEVAPQVEVEVNTAYRAAAGGHQ